MGDTIKRVADRSAGRSATIDGAIGDNHTIMSRAKPLHDPSNLMRFFYRLILSMLAVVAGQCFSAASEGVSFTRDIRPILSDTCFACHGPDPEKREADLRLDIAESAVDSGAISPGKLDESEVWIRINSSDPDVIMPPPESHEKLSDA